MSRWRHTARAFVVALAAAAFIGACDGADLGDQVKDAAQSAADEAKATAGAHVDEAIDAKSTELSATVEAKGEQLKETLVAKGGDMGGTVESLGSEVGGTLESRGAEMGATLEAKGGELRPTIQAAATRADQTFQDLREIADDMDGWGIGVATALGVIGEQSAKLDADRTLIADRHWQSDSNAAIADLTERAAQASDVASGLERDDTQGTLQTTLTEMASDLDELAARLRTAIEAGDADAFVGETRRLADLAATVDALELLLDKVRPAP